LWPAVYLDDDEAYEAWAKIGVPRERIKRYGEEHNYWFSGEIGPCGPCSEIHYDFGEQFGCGPKCEPSHDCERFVEIWNLVFMSFYCDGEQRNPLPSKNVDTGAGLERNACVLLFESEGWDKRRLPSVYDTDLFVPVIGRIEELSGKRYGEDEKTDRAMRIVAEHSRAVTFLIGDERTPVLPSNEERGYVVRRMLRRAVYFARRQLGIEQAVMEGLVETVVAAMAPSYPELERQRGFIKEIVAPEERQFDETLSRGVRGLEDILRFHRAISARSATRVTTVSTLLSQLKTDVKTPDDIYENSQTREAISKEIYEWGRDFEDILTHPNTSGTPMFGILGDVITELEHHFLRPIHNLVQGWAGEAHIARELEHQGAELDSKRLTSGLLLNIGLMKQDPRMAATHSKMDFREALRGFVDRVKSDVGSAASEVQRIRGIEAFTLHDTYGFPIELTREIAAEKGFAIDEVGFEVEMERQRERARAAAGGKEALVAEAFYGSASSGETIFKGYEGLEAKGLVTILFSDGDRPSEVAAPTVVEIMLAETPFYPEGGGQVGDRGEIVGPRGRVLVEDTQRVADRLIVHRGHVVEGRIEVGDEVTARVDAQHRADTMRNHTATHLLHAALRKVLGTHVKQGGSLVAPDHLRFDFTHTEAVTRDQLDEVERLVNEKVRQNLPVHTRLTTFDEAMSEGVLAFFGEKYGEEVRVVEVNTVAPRFSAELCGGTHCERTGDVGLVIVTGESSTGAGMRRIEALSGRGAEEYMRRQSAELEEASRRVGGARGDLVARIDALVTERDALQKRVERLERSLASAPAMDQIVSGAVDVDGVKVLASQLDLPSLDAMRYSVDAVRKAMPSGVAVLGSVIDGRPQFVAIVSADVILKGPKAGEILRRVAAVTGGGGGGRPEMAQGGGKDPSKIAAALAVVPNAVREMLSSDGRSGKE
jgi:alanyl-tRNA synthetase